MATCIIKAHVYEFAGRTLICPYSDLKEGDIVASFLPIKKVDPSNKYQFVINENGISYSVTKSRIKHNKTISFKMDILQCESHNSYVERLVYETARHLKQYLNDSRISKTNSTANTTGNESVADIHKGSQ